MKRKKVLLGFFLLIFLFALGSAIVLLNEHSKFDNWKHKKNGFLSDVIAMENLFNQKEITDYRDFFNDIDKNTNSINFSSLFYHFNGNQGNNSILKNFKLTNFSQECFYFSLNIDTNFQGSLRQEFIEKLGKNINGSESCNTERCYIIFTQEGLLYKEDNYLCK